MALEFEWRVALEQLGEQGQWIQLALAVEYAGLDGLWLAAGAGAADSLGVAGALCAHTHRVRLSVGVAPEVMLPAALAQTLHSLQSISGGRVAVYLPHPRQGQLGRAFGDWLNLDQHQQRNAEYLHILSELLNPAGLPLDFSGRYFQLENGGQARRLSAPAVVLDEHQPLPLLAAYADLCLLQCAPPPQLERQIRRVREAAAPRAPGFALHLGIIVRETAELAWEAALLSWQRSGIAVAASADDDCSDSAAGASVAGGIGAGANTSASAVAVAVAGAGASASASASASPSPSAGARHPASTTHRAPAPPVVAHARGQQPLRALEVYPQLYAPTADRPLQLVGSLDQVRARLEQLHSLGVTRIIIDSEPAVAEVLRIGELLLPALDHLRPRPVAPSSQEPRS